MKKLIYLTFLIIAGLTAKAQDKIYKTNGEVLETKVLEVGSSEVKYKIFANQNGPTYTLQKPQILKIVYQNGTTEKFEAEIVEIEPVLEKRAQNIYIEGLLAAGVVYSFNFDTRFSQKRNGLGARVGLGGDIGYPEEKITIIPAYINYLLGKNNGKHFFEIGIGAIYSHEKYIDSTESYVIATMNLMYRYQPLKNGLNLRAGLVPVSDGYFFFPSAGLSLGYTF